MKEYGQKLAMNHSTFAIVVSEFEKEIGENLLKGTLRALKEGGINEDQIVLARVPGAFELPVIAMRFANTGEFDAIICLGAVIRGETAHFDYVCSQAAQGIQQTSIETETPILFGVLTTDTRAQAEARSTPDGRNKGFEVGVAALKMVALTQEIDDDFDQYSNTFSSDELAMIAAEFSEESDPALDFEKI